LRLMVSGDQTDNPESGSFPEALVFAVNDAS
jgi:hypothetical protein